MQWIPASALATLLWLAGPALPQAAVPDPPFLDVTDDVGLDFRHANGFSGRYLFLETIGSGAGLLDFDFDGDLDAFLVQGGTFEGDRVAPGTHRLYRQDRRGEPGSIPRFVDLGPAAIDGASCYGMGVATADVDGDGGTDLYVTCFGSNLLLRNRGDGTLALVPGAGGADEPRWSTAASFFDADGDGNPDLFVGNYVEYTVASDKTCFNYGGTRDYCSPGSYAPVSSRLFRNRGDGTFEDASLASGIGGEPANTLGSLAFDAAGDGRLALYEAIDAMPNRLWTPVEGGGFQDAAVLAGCAVSGEGDPEGSMGVVAEDFDGDSDRDLFVTHLRNEKNTYYERQAGGFYEDRSFRAGLGQPSWIFTAFGVAAIDVDNDGRQDLLVANGAVTIRPELAAAGDSFPFRERNQLFRNRGNGRFEELAPELAGPVSQVRSSRGLAWGDVDGDGDGDALVANSNDRAQLLSSRWGTRGSWIGVRPVSAAGAPVLHAAATVERPGRPTLHRWSQVDGSYLSSHDPGILAGLGKDHEVSALTVSAPGHPSRRFRNLPAERYYVVPE